MNIFKKILKKKEFSILADENNEYIYLFEQDKNNKERAYLVGVFCNESRVSDLDFRGEEIATDYYNSLPGNTSTASAYQRTSLLKSYMVENPLSSNINQAAYDSQIIKEIIKAQEIFKQKQNRPFNSSEVGF